MEEILGHPGFLNYEHIMTIAITIMIITCIPISILTVLSLKLYSNYQDFRHLRWCKIASITVWRRVNSFDNAFIPAVILQMFSWQGGLDPSHNLYYAPMIATVIVPTTDSNG